MFQAMAPKVFLQRANSEVKFDNILSLCDKYAQNSGVDRKTKCIVPDDSLPESSSPSHCPSLGIILLQISENLAKYQEQITQIRGFAHFYDSKTGVQANGYRSFLNVAARFIQHLTQPLLKLNSKGPQRATETDLMEMSHYDKCLRTLIQINGFLLEMHELSEDGEMFPKLPDIRSPETEALARKIADVDTSCFYGKGAAFHFKGDSVRIVQPLLLAMASLGDVFSGSFLSLFRKVTNTMFGIRYTLDSDLLAARVLENAKDMPVEFVKTFYNMPELELIPSRRKRSPGIKANYVIEIPPEPMAIMNTQGAAFQVPVPTSHLGPGKAVQVRLISPFRSEGMIGKCSNCVPNVWPGSNCSCQITPESDAIFFHLHGGGFVSQTSKSHEPYLKAWAKTLGIPILSVDYSLAPEAPFPRAVEEVLFAYCWMRNNFKLLGTTGRKVIIGGDSAGGNLSVGLILQCIQLSLPKPDHLVAFYPSLLCQMNPSPSRLICLLDPLVMFPCLLRCLNCYADPDYNTTCPRTYTQELEACQNYSDPLLSPLLIPQELFSLFPPTSLFSSDIDPCLDETVSFSNKLMTAGTKVTLEVLSGLPHGFLSLTGMSKDCALAVEHITEKMRDIVLT